MKCKITHVCACQHKRHSTQEHSSNVDNISLEIDIIPHFSVVPVEYKPVCLSLLTNQFLGLTQHAILIMLSNAGILL